MKIIEGLMRTIRRSNYPYNNIRSVSARLATVAAFSLLPGTASCVSYADKTCPAGTNPTFTADVTPTPAKIKEADYKSGLELTWKPKVNNCDGSTGSVALVCHFSGGDLTVSPDENGYFTITKTLTSQPDKAILCDIKYANPKEGAVQQAPITNAVKLYPPTIDNTSVNPTNTCPNGKNPKIEPGVNLIVSPSQKVNVNELVTIAFPARSVSACDNTKNNLKVFLVINNKEKEITAQIDAEGNYYYTTSFTKAGFYSYALKVVDLVNETVDYRPYSNSDQNTIQVTDPAACPYGDKPIIAGGYDIAVEPGKIVKINQPVTLSFSADPLSECDLTLDSLEVSFGIQVGKELEVHQAVKVGGYYTYVHPGFAVEGTYAYKLMVRDTSRGTWQELPAYADPNYKITVTPGAASCQYGEEPKIISGVDIIVSPANKVAKVNDFITLRFPADHLSECDSTSDHLQIFFEVQGQLLPAAKVGNDYVVTYQVTQVGTYAYALVVNDTKRNTTTKLPGWNDPNYHIYVYANDSTCYEQLPPPSGEHTPLPKNSTVQGSSEPFTYQFSFPNVCGQPLTLDQTAALAEAAKYFHQPQIIWDGNNFKLTGPVRPDVTGGTMLFNFTAANSQTKIVDLYLPTIPALSAGYTTADNFAQVNKTINVYLMTEVPGATNYHLNVKRPGGEDNYDSPTPLWAYTPTAAGPHNATIGATTYNSSVIFAPLSFGVNSAGSGATCYDMPTSGAIAQTPLVAGIIRGDKRQFTWTVNDLEDCLHQGLAKVDDGNVASILFNPSVIFSGKILTVAGIVRSTIAGGSVMKVNFQDQFGRPLTVKLGPPAINEPQVEIIDPWITISENAALQLLADPFGITKFNWTITRPNATPFFSGDLASSLYTIDKTNKTQLGIYSFSLSLQAADGPFSITGAFVVNEDPKP